jgi:hypothetical protein
MKKPNPKNFIFIILVTILTDTYIMPIHDLVIVILPNMFKNRYINKTNLSAFNILYFYVFVFLLKKFK